MDTPPSGMPSPPLSPHGTPSSLTSEFPSLSGSLYSVVGADTPCDTTSDYDPHHPRQTLGFSSTEHPESLSHLILPSLALHDHHHRGLSRAASVSAFGGDQHQLQRTITRREPTVELQGNMRLLVLGRHGAGKTLLCESLVQGLVEVHGWSYQEGIGRVLTAATTTSTAHDRAPNVHITRADGWDESDENVVDSVMHAVQAPLHELDQVFRPSASTMNLSVDLLSSPAAPLYTAAILVLPSSLPSPTEALLIRALSEHLPTLMLSFHRPRRRHSPDYHSRPQSLQRMSRADSRHYYSPLHSRAPSIPTIDDAETAPAMVVPPTSVPPFTSHRALREWLFEPLNVQKLRKEAAYKFFGWRERQRTIEAYDSAHTPTHPVPSYADAFERFTFDVLFSEEDFDGISTDADESSLPAAETDEESGVEHQEDPDMAKGYIEDRERANGDAAWEAELSRMVALRKRQTITRMETIRPAPPPAPQRQPLSSILPPSFDDAVELSEKGHHPHPSPLLHDRGYSSGDGAKYHDCADEYESEESAMPLSSPSTASSLPSSEKTKTKTKYYYSSSSESFYDPLHIPSLFSLLLSMLPDIGWRLLWPPRSLFFSGAATSKTSRLPTHANDLGGSEKTMLVLREMEVEVKEEKASSNGGGGVSLPMVGVLCAAAAGVGFCAGAVAVGGRAAALVAM